MCIDGRNFTWLKLPVSCKASATILWLLLSELAQCSASTCSAVENQDAFESEAWVEDGLCAHVFAGGLQVPRGIVVLPDTNEVLVVEVTPSRVLLLFDSDGDGVADVRKALASAPGLNHGLAVFGGSNDRYLYASSDTTVYRWRFQTGSSPSAVQNPSSPEVVVHSMNANGFGGAPRGHWTRTLVFDGEGNLYVSIGSEGNVDANSYRSRIRRFPSSYFSPPFGRSLPSGGLDFAAGEVFADGLRNEVGLAFDASGVLWGVENGADNLFRSDLGGDIHNENPAEELNRFPPKQPADPALHFGYPWCWTEYNLPAETGGLGRGTQWAWPTTMNDGVHDDAWCRQQQSSALAMQAHSAPLGITFYNFSATPAAFCKTEALPSLPREFDGDAFIGYHGSWNRAPATGYKVVRVAYGKPGDALPLQSSEEPKDVLRHKGSAATWPSGVRPVDVKFDTCGRLLVSSDGTRRGSRYTEGQLFLVSGRPAQSSTSSTTSALSVQDGGGTTAATTTALRHGAGEVSGTSLVSVGIWNTLCTLFFMLL